MRRSKGFTIVEVLVTITVIVILASVTVYPSLQALPRSRDTERLNDVASIARRLEQAYAAKEVGSPAYPTGSKLVSDISSRSGTVARLDIESLKAPRSASTSVVVATTNSTSAPKGAGSPVLNEYVYQPLTSTGGLCSGTDNCVRFFIYYRTEVSNSVKIVKSIRQQ